MQSGILTIRGQTGVHKQSKAVMMKPAQQKVHDKH